MGVQGDQAGRRILDPAAPTVGSREVEQLSRRLRSCERALERGDEVLEQFGRILSHDLRAPLRGIAAAAEWLEEDLVRAADADSLENLRLLRGRAARLTALAEGLVRYARAGRAQGAPEVIDADAIARSVIDGIPAPEGVELTIASPLPRVRYDSNQLREILEQLVRNAVQHLGEPRGEVLVSAVEEGGDWRFAVRDSGVGIAEKDAERVFDLFHTLGGRREDSGDRIAGVGLAIVKRIVERNCGTVRLRSAPDDGTELSFTVPRDPAAIPASDSAPTRE